MMMEQLTLPSLVLLEILQLGNRELAALSSVLLRQQVPPFRLG